MHVQQRQVLERYLPGKNHKINFALPNVFANTDVANSALNYLPKYRQSRVIKWLLSTSLAPVVGYTIKIEAKFISYIYTLNIRLITWLILLERNHTCA